MGIYLQRFKPVPLLLGVCKDRRRSWGGAAAEGVEEDWWVSEQERGQLLWRQKCQCLGLADCTQAEAHQHWSQGCPCESASLVLSKSAWAADIVYPALTTLHASWDEEITGRWPDLYWNSCSGSVSKAEWNFVAGMANPKGAGQYQGISGAHLREGVLEANLLCKLFQLPHVRFFRTYQSWVEWCRRT